MLPLRLKNLTRRVWKVIRVNWHLGVTAFGGPPVHFRIFNEKFVKRAEWIDEQIFQELFSISQSLSGPASTKMLYCINLLHGGLMSAVLSFFMWSLPGAIGMFALSIGVSNIDETLPAPVYALFSGLNSATVGVIALAAVELSQKAITDKLTRLIVFFTGAAGMLYNALWYFPVLMVISGLATLIFDFRWVHRLLKTLLGAARSLRPGRQGQTLEPASESQNPNTTHQLDSLSAGHPSPKRSTPPVSDLPVTETETQATSTTPAPSTTETEPRIIPASHALALPPSLTWKTGGLIVAAFFVTFVAIIALRGALPDTPLLYHLFANMYLAGTIIFGGGPVVIPLLREYVVAEGWVSPRDFLIGLAMIQAFPGPNFNFAVFLGSLTALGAGYSSVAGAVIAWVGIFTPGLVLVHGTMGIWSAVRSRRWVKSVLRGVNAGAVGLMYTAVYRIFGVGYLDEQFQSGRSLGDDPWWVVITASSYVGGRYFGLNAPSAIILGAVMGLVRYGVVSA
ncbi:chromate transporter-domain-containing protein [Corynascus novoguineensis]|uniref:Chromate transporter-domain-containing protein n=1 Tax=Corynascus novoguineensis TaxID=1126955 RepID=A0AAN7CMV9_9PEZI|nr:chromate transporter-domain-containing protein [Corynascus novoguineensis]